MSAVVDKFEIEKKVSFSEILFVVVSFPSIRTKLTYSYSYTCLLRNQPVNPRSSIFCVDSFSFPSNSGLASFSVTLSIFSSQRIFVVAYPYISHFFDNQSWPKVIPNNDCIAKIHQIGSEGPAWVGFLG